MKMLRWMCGVIRLDKIRNEKIRGSTTVGEISKKVQERRMRWYRHVMRKDDEYVGKRATGIEVQGSRRRGRPKKRWVDYVKDDLRETRDCQERRCTTELHGGDHRPISTPHRSGIKMKKKRLGVFLLFWELDWNY